MLTCQATEKNGIIGLAVSVSDIIYEITGSIPGTSTSLNVDYAWNGVDPPLWGQFLTILDSEVGDLIKKVDINWLDGA